MIVSQKLLKKQKCYFIFEGLCVGSLSFEVSCLLPVLLWAFCYSNELIIQ